MTNSIFLKKEVEKVAAERLTICRACPFNSKLAGRKGIERCLRCGCLLAWKTRNLAEVCPDLPEPRWLPVEGVTRELAEQIDDLIDNE